MSRVDEKKTIWSAMCDKSMHAYNYKWFESNTNTFEEYFHQWSTKYHDWAMQPWTTSTINEIQVLFLESRDFEKGKEIFGLDPTLTQYVPYASQVVRWYHSSHTCAKSKSRISMRSKSSAKLMQQAISPCMTWPNLFSTKSKHLSCVHNFTDVVFEWLVLLG